MIAVQETQLAVNSAAPVSPYNEMMLHHISRVLIYAISERTHPADPRGNSARVCVTFLTTVSHSVRTLRTFVTCREREVLCVLCSHEPSNDTVYHCTLAVHLFVPTVESKSGHRPGTKLIGIPYIMSPLCDLRDMGRALIHMRKGPECMTVFLSRLV